MYTLNGMILPKGNTDVDKVFIHNFRGKTLNPYPLAQGQGGTNLHRPLKKHVQHMCSLLHLPDVKWIGVTTLPVLDRVHKTIGELSLRSK